MSDPAGDQHDSDLSASLTARWEALFGDRGAEAFSTLWTLYHGLRRPLDSVGRYYHNFRHILDCLEQMALCEGKLADPRAVAAAIWFHDAIYEPSRSDNEAQSADVAAFHLGTVGESPSFVATVSQLILDTRHTAPPATRDGESLVDIDLSILGRSPEVFDAYDRAIRREYAHVPEDAYRTGRAAVLRSFLSRPAIYRTAPFRERYEVAAQTNLSRVILALTRGNS
jgi:predicted metal-dependent HD superfamily phosphohydrolase